MTLSLYLVPFSRYSILKFSGFDLDLWPLGGHLRSKIFSPFESPYRTSYLTSIDTFSLSRTVFEIFDFKIFRVWPWPLTFRGHQRSKIFSPFESSYMTSYLTSIDTFSLSRTVFEIFDFKVFRVWPCPLTFRGHLGSKIFSPFESPYMTSYLTSIDIFPLSRNIFEKIRVKLFWVKQNGGFWPFQGQGHWPIFFISRKGSDSHRTASNDILRVKIGSAVLAALSSKSVKSWKKRKKDEPLYVGHVYLRPGKFFRNQNLLDCLGRWRYQSCQILFQSVHSDVFGKGSNFVIFSVNHGWPLQLLYYRTTVISWWRCDRNVTFVSIPTKLMSGNSQKYKYINIVISTFDLKIQGQTWRNAFNMISLVVHVIETCVWCPRLLNGCQGIHKNRSHLFIYLLKFIMVVTLTFDLEIHCQTWRNAFNMISLVVYIVETCFWSTESIKGGDRLVPQWGTSSWFQRGEERYDVKIHVKWRNGGF